MEKKREEISFSRFNEIFENIYTKTIETKNNLEIDLHWLSKDIDNKTKEEYWYESDKLVCEMCDGWMQLTVWTFDEDGEEEQFSYIDENCENPDEIIKYNSNTSPYPFEQRKKFLTRDKEYVLGLFYKFYHDLDGAIDEIKETFF